MAEPRSITATMLTPKQVAQLIGRTEVTLSEWRKLRIGPPFLKLISKVYYRREDIDAWLSASRTDTLTQP